MVEVATRLGTGLYSVNEAAVYARVSPRMIGRWLFGGRSGRAVLHPQYGTGGDKIVSYLDLVQTVAVREIRNQKKIPLEKIRQAISYAEREHGITYPFARKHTTYFDGENILLRVKGEYIGASGRDRGQKFFQFVELYLQKLEFGKDGLSSRYHIFRAESGVQVTMDPRCRFGEPMLPCGYSAASLWDAIQVEGGIEQAARACEAPINEVRAAYEFFDSCIGTRAA